MKYTHIVWDFNGTILDDVQICIDSVNMLLEARGLPLLASVEAYRAVQEFPVIGYYKKIGFDFSKESFDDVAVEWVAEYMRRFPTAKVHDDALEMAATLRAEGAKQVLLSATQLKMLQGQVESLAIGRYFDEIRGMGNIYAHGKISLAEAWKEANPDSVPLFIGDTDHDLAVARSIGADCILFAGGHQARERLSALGVPVIDSFDQLNQYL